MKNYRIIWLYSLLTILLLVNQPYKAKAEWRTEMEVKGIGAQFVAEFHPNSAKLILIHIVRPGDTLWSIASKYGITLKELLQLNPSIKLGQPILVNQKVNVSYKETTVKPIENQQNAQPASTYDTHTVRSGETVFSIARLYGLTPETIMKKNQLNLNSLLKIGDELFIPMDAQVQTYVVQPKDTLTKISKKYNTTVQRLSEQNQLDSKQSIFVGQTLVIPKN